MVASIAPMEATWRLGENLDARMMSSLREEPKAAAVKLPSGRPDVNDSTWWSGTGGGPSPSPRFDVISDVPLNIDNLPRFSTEEAEELAHDLYGMAAAVRELPSERDQNFYLEDGSGTGFVLKIAARGEDRALLDAQNRAMGHVGLHGESVECPRVMATAAGDEIATARGRDGSEHFVRLVTWIPGTTLADVTPHTPELLADFGGFLGRLDRAFTGFTHPATRRSFYWDLALADSTVTKCGKHIEDPDRRALVEGFRSRFRHHVAPKLAELRTSVIHNDANDHNVVVSSGATTPPHVVGIIDFGDMVESRTVFNLAVGAAYGMLDEQDPIAAAAQIIGGYHGASPLGDGEVELLYDLISMRLCMSVSISAFQKRENPANAYLTVSEQAAWAALNTLATIDPDTVLETFRTACQTQP
jgi:Ser/Thr protein kinase RdoA (MazF antagonist)